MYHQKRIEKWSKSCILLFPKKGDIGVSKTYRGIILTAKSAKVYNAMLLNPIRSEIKNVMRENQNGFRRNRPTFVQILTVRGVIEEVRAKNLKAVLLLIFQGPLTRYTEGRWKKYFLHTVSQRKLSAIIMLYRNTQSIVLSPDIVAGVLQGNTLVPTYSLHV
ncbi:uncharacterized protein LOC115209477 [Octopus sinensis]|uniref:Uncharacterized protein LOC115209477 n=1 Tax=Octopus sinensis TaxID=2607531 RepID=A0A6P7S6M5_9MOLL|nr:uncharacterized protein LOC115209477 [Octopus sinensis]